MASILSPLIKSDFEEKYVLRLPYPWESDQSANSEFKITELQRMQAAINEIVVNFDLGDRLSIKLDYNNKQDKARKLLISPRSS